MNKILKVLLMLIFAVLLSTTYSLAAITGTVNTNGVRVRKEASTDSQVITSLNNGAKVEVINKSNDWYSIKYNDYEGYMHSDYITLEEKPESEQQNKPMEQATQQNEESNSETNISENENAVNESEYPKSIVLQANLDVYILPVITSSKINKIEVGITVVINKQVNDWSYITYNNTKGWVRNYSLKDVTETDATINSEQPQDNVGTIEINKKGYVNASAVNFRDKPDTTAEVIETLQRNAEVLIVSEENGWYKVNYNKKTGYISKDLVSDKQVEVTTRASEARQENEYKTKTGYVSVRVANVRKEATTNSIIKTTVKQKDKLEIVGEENTFYKVNINNEIGYIAKSLVVDNLSDIVIVETPNVAVANTTTTKTGNSIVDFANQYMGYKYVLGGTTPSGFDCSGFVYYVFNSCGYSISRSCSAQASTGIAVSKSELQPGDIVFFDNTSDGSIGHVGIYVGDGYMIHAANSRRGVVKDTINSGYYNTYYYSARRIV